MAFDPFEFEDFTITTTTFHTNKINGNNNKNSSFNSILLTEDEENDKFSRLLSYNGTIPSLCEIIETQHSLNHQNDEIIEKIKIFDEIITKPKIEGLEEIDTELEKILNNCIDDIEPQIGFNHEKIKEIGEMKENLAKKPFQVDRYGFVIEEDSGENNIHLLESRNKFKELKSEGTSQILAQWDSLSTEKKRKFIQKLTKKGIANNLRGELWKKLANISDIHEENTSLFLKLLGETSSFEGQIHRDLARSLPQKHVFFQKSGGMGQTALFNVLKAYSIYDQKVGYCQGMGLIAAIFLLYVSQEEAFTLLMKLITKYEMGGLFEPGFPTLYKLFFIHEKLLRLWLPNLDAHFKGQGVEASMYAFGWYTTIFVNSLSFPYVIRILDLFLVEGVKVLFRISIAILKLLQKDLLQLEFDQIVLRLRNLNKVILVPPEELINCAMEFTLSDKRLEKLTKGYEKKNSLE